MLSISSGTPIAFILNKEIIDKPQAKPQDIKDLKKVYIKGDIYTSDDLPHEIDTTIQNKCKIFKDYLKLNKRLTSNDITSLLKTYQCGEEMKCDKLLKVFEAAKDFVTLSLKKYVSYGIDTELFPIVEDLSKKSVRVFISGQSESGKSFFISQFLKYNRPKASQGVFIFSPFTKDKSLDGIKNLIHMDLDEFEKEEEREFEAPGDIPEDSIVIFDDIESHSSRSKDLMRIRDIFLERGRHHGDAGVSVITVSHNPLGHNKTKTSIRESQYLLLFPKTNPRDTEALLKKYCGYSSEMIDEVISAKTRWLWVSKRVPSYFVSQHSVRLW